MIALSSYPARCGLAIVSGAVFALAYPPLGWGWLVVPGLAGLLVALRGLQGSRVRAIGFLHGMAAYGVGLSWLFNVFGGMVVALWCVLAAFTALFAEMQGRAEMRGVTGWKLAGFTALNWCGWEFIRAELFPLKFPWMSAGLAMGPNALLPWIGVYGVGAFVVLTAGLLVLRKWRFAAIPAVVLISGIVLWPAIPKPAESDPLAVKVAGLQWEEVALKDYLEESRKLPAGTQHVVWPEYAVPFDLRTDARELERVQTLCRERGITLTLGTQARA